MFLVLEKIHHIKSRLTTEQIYQYGVSAAIVFIMGFALFAMWRPVTSVQLQRIQYLAEQQSHPESQLVALKLHQQEKISVGQYLKLMHVYQYEEQRAQQLPPFISEEKTPLPY